jgi:hypothetical protein
LSADSHVASACSNDSQSATAARTFSIGSSSASGCRGTSGANQCTRTFSDPIPVACGSAPTWCRLGVSCTHRPSRAACEHVR